MTFAELVAKMPFDSIERGMSFVVPNAFASASVVRRIAFAYSEFKGVRLDTYAGAEATVVHRPTEQTTAEFSNQIKGMMR